STECLAEGTQTAFTFEDDSVGAFPRGWKAGSSFQRGFSSDVSQSHPHSGRQAVVVHRDSVGIVSADFGTIGRTLDAKHLRGHRIALTAWLRFSPHASVPQGYTQLWLRLYGPGA